MNRKAIRYMLNKRELPFTEGETHFTLKTRTIENELVKEIGACNGAIEDHDMYGQLRIVNDE